MNESLKNLVARCDTMLAALATVQREQSAGIGSTPNSWIAGSVGPDGFAARWLQDGNFAALLEEARKELN